MTDTRGNLDRVGEIFERAFALDGAARAAYLREACGDDDALRVEVDSMLAARAELGNLLAEPTQGQASASADVTIASGPREQVGQMIGHYKLLEQIGEGGFGVVWAAEQREPVKRRVALKIIKLGMDTKQVIARFEAERQALAMMDHPNIATVLDAGATDTGRPYFVMELVKGIPITDYCDQNNLTVHKRIGLFKLVCAAVQHAHQKGIIHRDIKPSNVLVTLHDGKPVPKVIDFGIAKATNAELTEKTLFTENRQMVGTPEYMSPEQAQMSGLGIDTRSDIYALGVLLYELLTGATPFDGRRLRSAGLDEIQRIIGEEEPHKPSTRLSTLETLPSIAAHRNIEPKKLGLLIRGDLDWIIMKALEKDRTRRYETAAGFAADLGRHLGNEPVLASPPSSAYRLRKFVRRNRSRVIGAAVIAVVLLAATGVSIGFAVSEARQRRVAQAASERAEKARAAEKSQRHIAEVKTDEAVDARREAETQRDTARRQSYVANIVAARASIQTNEIRTARIQLDQAPSEHRGWEWRFLHARLDQSLAVLRGHEEAAFSIAFSPDGSRIASVAGDDTVRLWDATSGEQLAVLRGQEGWWGSVAFSPDGSRIASGSDDYTVRLWDASSGQELAVLRGHENWLSSVAFSPDGSRIASGSDDNTVRLWDAASGEELAVLRGHDEGVHSVAFSPNGSRIASGSEDKTVRLWDVASGQELAVLRGHDEEVNSVRFSPDGSRIASAGDKRVRLWDVSSGQELAVLRGHDEEVNSVRFSPDGSRIASAGDKRVRLWHATSGEQLVVLRGHETTVFSIAFSPDGSRVASGSEDNTVRLWDAASGQELALLRGHEKEVISVAFSPDGSRIASGSEDNTVRLWNASSGGKLAVLHGHDEEVNSVAFSPDGSRIASGSGDKTVRLWDATSGQELALLRRHEEDVNSVRFSPDGSRIASAGDNTVRLWDAASGQELALLRGHENEVISVAFSPDGSRIASGSDDNTVRLWDAASGEELAVLRGHDETVLSVAFSPDGSRIASGSDDNTMRLWDAASGQELALLRGHEREITSVAFSPDGSRIASGSGDNTVWLWDASSGQELALLRGHQDDVTSVSFSPDGSRIASGSEDNTVRLWDAMSGEQLAVVRGHEGDIFSIAFSPDGSRIASGSHDDTVRVWDTVAYRDRVRQRDEALRAKETMSPFIDELFSEGLYGSAVVARVRTDASLSEPLRRAAINLVLKRSSEMREQTREAYRQAMSYYRRGLYDDAEPLLVDALETSRRAFGHDNPKCVPLITRLAGVYDKQGRFDVARSYLAELTLILKRATERQDASAADLDEFARGLLTDEPSSLRDPKTALPIALTANELTDHKIPEYLDTLAVAYHLTGDTAAAIETQQRAVDLAPDDADLKATLAKYEAALAGESETGAEDGQ